MMLPGIGVTTKWSGFARLYKGARWDDCGIQCDGSGGEGIATSLPVFLVKPCLVLIEFSPELVLKTACQEEPESFEKCLRATGGRDVQKPLGIGRRQEGN